MRAQKKILRKAFIYMAKKTQDANSCRLGKVGGQAVLEGVAFAVRDNFEVAKEQGLELEVSTLCGGGAKSLLWRKILANTHFARSHKFCRNDDFER